MALPESSRILELQDEALARWYVRENDDPSTQGSVEPYVLEQHRRNFQLWNLEDEARRSDATDVYIADVKRSIDQTNQQRNDLVEKVDEALLALLSGVDLSGAEQNSETAGMMIDRMSILGLKVYHMGQYAARAETDELKRECEGKREVLRTQRGDLAACLGRLLEQFTAGRRYFKLYRQYKAYNDPRLNPAMAKKRSS